MVWLRETTTAGSGLYLEIRSLERKLKCGEGVAVVTATVGDGSYEGDVLVEIGAQSEVCYVDQWLDPAALREFFRRIDRMRLTEELADICAAAVHWQRQVVPHGFAPARLQHESPVVARNERA